MKPIQQDIGFETVSIIAFTEKAMKKPWRRTARSGLKQIHLVTLLNR